jgi:hypothetical protein
LPRAPEEDRLVLFWLLRLLVSPDLAPEPVREDDRLELAWLRLFCARLEDLLAVEEPDRPFLLLLAVEDCFINYF